MAGANQDPLEAVIAVGRVGARPVDHYQYPTVITVDLELLAQTLVDRLKDVYLYNSDIRDRYYGTDDEMISNITALVDYAVALTYNRLRFILKCYYPSIITKRMNLRCPVHKSLELPAWLSSTLSCIGPCHISDGPHDTLVVYATTAETMNSYGRRKPVEYIYGHYDRIMTHLRSCKVAVSPLDFKEMKGSFYPTIRPPLNGAWAFYSSTF